MEVWRQIDRTLRLCPSEKVPMRPCQREISLFQESMQTLKIAQTKYSDSQEALKKISPEVKDTRIMVPLTGSMFVRGTFKDTKRVLVDVGTGYYLKIGMDDARDFFKRKVAFVTEQMEKIQKLGMERSKAREGRCSARIIPITTGSP
ncbi:unnamed protein product [Nesidiocoris tenuis]|uniref:Prefoldin subunit 5 n=1 Tax=Nesidiocoris tenuis TaxID=355587 RepID=A0A6H5HUK9_9HEMI|nr:unnamed protein product [Nesidiocoris tenuis]